MSFPNKFFEPENFINIGALFGHVFFQICETDMQKKLSCELSNEGQQTVYQIMGSFGNLTSIKKITGNKLISNRTNG